MVRQDDIDNANKDENRLKEGDKGIKWERGCTDIICCFVFLVFLVAMVGASFLALTKGDPLRILTAFDSDGNACGKTDQCSTAEYAWPQGTACPTTDEARAFQIPADALRFPGKKITIPVARDFTAYKLKYLPLTSFGKSDLFNAVCVKACPGTGGSIKTKGVCVKKSDDKLIDGKPTVVTTDYTVVAGGTSQTLCGEICMDDANCKGFQFTSILQVATCVASDTVTCATTDECRNYKVAVKGDGKTRVAPLTGAESCFEKTVDTTRKSIEFLPNSDVKGYGPTGLLYALFPTKEKFSICFPDEAVGIEMLNDFIKEVEKESGMVKYLVQLKDVWEILIGMSVATIFISIFYIFLLKWITKPLLYTSMLIILIGFVLAGGWCWLKKDEYDPEFQPDNHNYAFAGAITFWVIGGVYLCFIICCWKNISLGASIMETASDFVAGNLRVLWLPITSYIVCVPFICYWVVTAVYLYSMGIPEFKNESFMANIKWEDNTRYMMWFFLFGLLWCVAFIICLQQFMIAATVCQWYFTGQGGEMADSPYTASVWRSFKWGIWWHCGSIAFGSFIIALVTFIRIIFEYIVYQYEQVGNKENPVYKCLKCYIRYVLYCLDKYVKFISKNAFIQIALNSTNFCSAAWTSFWLILRHCGRFSAAAMVGWIMMMLGKGTIMGASCFLTFLIVKETTPEVEQPLVPAAIILLISYMVGSMFLSVFSFACTAILHCFILDEDTGGSKFTPDSLQSFLTMNDAKAEKEGRFKKVDSKTGAAEGKTNDME